MRKVMLATVVLAFLGILFAESARVQKILGKIADRPPPESHDFPFATARGAVSPPNTSGGSGIVPGSGTAAKGTTAAAAEWAERMFTAGLSKDFGAVPFGTQLSHRFAITNIHAAAVEITGLRVGCGCVTATPGKRLLQPGESTTIDVTLDTRTFTGPNTETVRVAVGPNPQSSCLLKVSAVSQTDVVFKPDRVVNFGTVARGQAAVHSMDVEYRGTLAWKINEVIVPKDLPFTATLSDPLRQPGSVGYRLSVALKDDARSGRIRGYIYLKTNQTDAPLVPLLVTATVH